jgi:hypothetical protein
MERPAAIGIVLILGLAGCAVEPAGDRSEPAQREADPLPGFRLVDVSESAGLRSITLVGGSPTVDYIIGSLGTGAAWLDYDLDGDADLYLVQGATPSSPDNGPPDLLLRNDGDPDGDGIPAFVDVTAQSGLGDRRWSTGAAVADYDNDGDPDIYLTNWGANRLYRNNGDGTFDDIAAAAGVDDARWGVTAGWSDVDRDGRLDLYVTNYVEFTFERYPARGIPLPDGRPPCMWRGIEVYCGPRTLVPESDVFFRNEGDADGDGIPTFTERTAEAGLATVEARFGLGVRFFDADGDGDDDLYVANDSLQNAYFVNLGNGRFQETSILAGVAYNEQGDEQAGMGVGVGDYNLDGALDLAVTNFSHDHDTLYRNEGDGFFTDVSYVAGIGSPSYLTLGWGIGFIDFDQDGLEDLFVSHGHVYPQVDEKDLGTSYRQRNGIFRNLGDGTFEPVEERAGPGMQLVKASRALLPLDFDGDGDLDVLLTSLNDSPDLLRNDGAVGHWLQVGLRGTRSNRDGIGARVVIEAGGRRQTREIRRTTGFAASTLPIAHFGLGSATTVDSLEVRWPSGHRTFLENLPADQRLTIDEE